MNDPIIPPDVVTTPPGAAPFQVSGTVAPGDRLYPIATARTAKINDDGTRTYSFTFAVYGTRWQAARAHLAAAWELIRR